MKEKDKPAILFYEMSIEVIESLPEWIRRYEKSRLVVSKAGEKEEVQPKFLYERSVGGVLPKK